MKFLVNFEHIKFYSGRPLKHERNNYIIDKNRKYLMVSFPRVRAKIPYIEEAFYPRKDPQVSLVLVSNWG